MQNVQQGFCIENIITLRVFALSTHVHVAYPK